MADKLALINAINNLAEAKIADDQLIPHLEAICADNKIKLAQTDNKGQNALIRAVILGYDKVVVWLLKKNKGTFSDAFSIEHDDLEGHNAMFYAVGFRDSDDVKPTPEIMRRRYIITIIVKFMNLAGPNLIFCTKKEYEKKEPALVHASKAGNSRIVSQFHPSLYFFIYEQYPFARKLQKKFIDDYFPLIIQSGYSTCFLWCHELQRYNDHANQKSLFKVVKRLDLLDLFPGNQPLFDVYRMTSLRNIGSGGSDYIPEIYDAKSTALIDYIQRWGHTIRDRKEPNDEKLKKSVFEDLKKAYKFCNANPNQPHGGVLPIMLAAKLGNDYAMEWLLSNKYFQILEQAKLEVLLYLANIEDLEVYQKPSQESKDEKQTGLSTQTTDITVLLHRRLIDCLIVNITDVSLEWLGRDIIKKNIHLITKYSDTFKLPGHFIYSVNCRSNVLDTLLFSLKEHPAVFQFYAKKYSSYHGLIKNTHPIDNDKIKSLLKYIDKLSDIKFILSDNECYFLWDLAVKNKLPLPQIESILHQLSDPSFHYANKENMLKDLLLYVCANNPIDHVKFFIRQLYLLNKIEYSLNASTGLPVGAVRVGGLREDELRITNFFAAYELIKDLKPPYTITKDLEDLLVELDPNDYDDLLLRVTHPMVVKNAKQWLANLAKGLDAAEVPPPVYPAETKLVGVSTSNILFRMTPDDVSPSISSSPFNPDHLASPQNSQGQVFQPSVALEPSAPSPLLMRADDLNATVAPGQASHAPATAPKPSAPSSLLMNVDETNATAVLEQASQAMPAPSAPSSLPMSADEITVAPEQESLTPVAPKPSVFSSLMDANDLNATVASATPASAPPPPEPLQDASVSAIGRTTTPPRADTANLAELDSKPEPFDEPAVTPLKQTLKSSFDLLSQLSYFDNNPILKHQNKLYATQEIARHLFDDQTASAILTVLPEKPLTLKSNPSEVTLFHPDRSREVIQECFTQLSQIGFYKKDPALNKQIILFTFKELIDQLYGVGIVTQIEKLLSDIDQRKEEQTSRKHGM